MVIGTGDGKSYKDEYSYLVARHEDLSQQSQVADLDKRTPPPLPMVPSHSIAPHNPNPPGGGPYQIKPGERLADTALDPMPNIPSPPIVPKEWPPHPLNPTRVSSLVDKSAPAQWIGDKYYGRLFDTVEQNPNSNIILEHGKPGSHLGTVSPKEEVELARDREDDPNVIKYDKLQVTPGDPITDPMLGYGSSRDVRISDARSGKDIKGSYSDNFVPDLEVDNIHDWNDESMQKHFPELTPDDWATIKRNKEGGFGIQFNKRDNKNLTS